MRPPSRLRLSTRSEVAVVAAVVLSSFAEGKQGVFGGSDEGGNTIGVIAALAGNENIGLPKVIVGGGC